MPLASLFQDIVCLKSIGSHLYNQVNGSGASGALAFWDHNYLPLGDGHSQSARGKQILFGERGRRRVLIFPRLYDQKVV